jgi:hypothetical protein
MNLYQHILLLLTLLTLVSGCTQLPPPKINGFGQQVDGEEQVIQGQNPDPVVKPSVSETNAGPNVASTVILNGDLAIAGQDAEMIFKALTAGSSAKKQGKHLVCEKQESASVACQMKIEIEKGSVQLQQKQIDANPVDATASTEAIDQDYVSDYLYFSKDNAMGKLTLKGEVARTLYVGMIHPAGTFDLNADETYLPGVRKKGQNIDCYEQYLKSAPNDPIHTCYLYFLNRNTGELDVIQ